MGSVCQHRKREATIFNAFITRLIENTFTDELGETVVKEFYKDLHVSIPVQWLIRYMDEPNGGFWDNATTKNVLETRDDMIVKSMSQAIAQVTKGSGRMKRNGHGVASTG